MPDDPYKSNWTGATETETRGTWPEVERRHKPLSPELAAIMRLEQKLDWILVALARYAKDG